MSFQATFFNRFDSATNRLAHVAPLISLSSPLRELILTFPPRAGGQPSKTLYNFFGAVINVTSEACKVQSLDDVNDLEFNYPSRKTGISEMDSRDSLSTSRRSRKIYSEPSKEKKRRKFRLVIFTPSYSLLL